MAENRLVPLKFTCPSNRLTSIYILQVIATQLIKNLLLRVAAAALEAGSIFRLNLNEPDSQRGRRRLRRNPAGPSEPERSGPRTRLARSRPT